jgi:hypothetical protein
MCVVVHLNNSYTRGEQTHRDSGSTMTKDFPSPALPISSDRMISYVPPQESEQTLQPSTNTSDWSVYGYINKGKIIM